MLNGPYGRKDKLIKERRHDTYYQRGKWPSPTLCTACQALYVNGRWTWQDASSLSSPAETTCPACRRITDRYPAGYIKIQGSFYKEHQQDLMNLVRNVEREEKNGRPMERLMSIDKAKDHISITTTGVHLARRIGEALARSYKGELSIRYADDEHSVRINWIR